MHIVAYIISILTIIITLILLKNTFIPVINKTIKIKNKKTKTYFSIFLVISILEFFSISASILGEVSQYIIPAPNYIWLIFKISSLILLWIWSYFYFFIWINFKNKKT